MIQAKCMFHLVHFAQHHLSEKHKTLVLLTKSEHQKSCALITVTLVI